MRSLRLCVITLLLMSAIPAAAHNGVGASFKGPAGRYLVYAYDAEALLDRQLEYRLVLLERRTRDPVYDVTTAVSARRVGPGITPSETTGQVTTFGNIVFYRLPNPHPGHWVVTLHLDGPLGRGSTTFPAHAPPPVAVDVVTADDGGAPAWVYAVAGLAAIVVIAAVGWSLRRHRSRP
jgi:hypothetical protein